MLISVLIVLTVSLAGASGYIAYRLNNKNASVEESSASGFGEMATKDIYEPMNDAFAKTTCDSIVSREDLKAILLSNFADWNEDMINVTIVTNLSEDKHPKNCTYLVNESMYIQFDVYSYNKDSEIDDSYGSLLNRVNSKIANTVELDKGVFDPISYYFFGFALSENVATVSCHTNMFHPLNDFEYASLQYYNFGNCSSLVNFNKSIVETFVKGINSVTTGIYYPGEVNYRIK